MKEMNDTLIREQLQQAESLLLPPVLQADLAQQVRDRAGRQARSRRIVWSSAVAALILIAIGLWPFVASRPSQPAPVTPPIMADNSPIITPAPAIQPQDLSAPSPADTSEAIAAADPQAREVARLRAEIAQLRRELDGRMQLVEGMVRRQQQEKQLARWKTQAATASLAAVHHNLQTEQIAAQSYYQAEQYSMVPALRSAAVNQYRQIISLFPATPWAQQARQKLEMLESQQGI